MKTGHFENIVLCCRTHTFSFMGQGVARLKLHSHFSTFGHYVKE